MALFKRRDRIAIVCIVLLIFLGWTLKVTVFSRDYRDDVRVIPNAVELPAALNTPDSLNAIIHSLSAKININHAESTELELLPMIGPVKAAAIIEYRERHGPFIGISDIMNVPGIGPATFEQIRNRIIVEEKDE